MIDVNELVPYFKGQKKHIAYDKTVELAESIRVHSSGEKPEKLLGNYRPSETKEINDYRLKIFEPITKELFSQIETSLSKIRRSSDWSIKYEEDSVPAIVPSNETPEKYFEYNYPAFTSLSNWTFSVLLNQYLVDPNTVCLVMPMTAHSETEFSKPYPILFSSDSVIEYKEGEFAILKSSEKALFKKKGVYSFEGDKFYVIDKEVVQVWEQGAKDYKMTMEWKHGLNEMPCFKLRGKYLTSFGNNIVWESRISAIIARLNKVARQDSDLDASIVTHLYPEAWEFATQPCDKCFDVNMGQSTGKVKINDKVVGCSHCAGTGIVANSSPYKKMVIRPVNTNMGEQAVPTPPKGYITKPIEIVKLQDDIIDKNSYKALSAINMQFLMQTPANQSGYAKEVDRDELNNFIYSIAEDIVWIMDKIYAISIDIRYKYVASAEQLIAMRPSVAVPEKYDILSLTYLVDELDKAIKAQLPPSILQTMLIDFANKKFYNEPEVKNSLVTALKLDPMPCLSNDEKALIKLNNGVAEIDYIISCNLTRFIQIATDENEAFSTLEYGKQYEIISKIAQDYKTKNAPSTQIVNGIA